MPQQREPADLSTLPFPAGAVRVHRAPTQLRPRDGDSHPDRFDDPALEYRVRYFASTLKGSLLEVLDHFRPNAQADEALSAIEGVYGFNILDEEPSGSIPDRWLSAQRVVSAALAGRAFVNVSDPAVLAELYWDTAVQRALRDPLVVRAFGPAVRLDLGTICSVGPAGRTITQAVSQAVFNHPSRPSGISYVTRFDHSERCWAAFDERVEIEFDLPRPLDATDPDDRSAIQAVAHLYKLAVPAPWR
jgi:RES domain